jgi:hypothetical protein
MALRHSGASITQLTSSIGPKGKSGKHERNLLTRTVIQSVELTVTKPSICNIQLWPGYMYVKYRNEHFITIEWHRHILQASTPLKFRGWKIIILVDASQLHGVESGRRADQALVPTPDSAANRAKKKKIPPQPDSNA